MPDWVLPLIGRPYVARGKGPDGFDCWGLCCHVWREHFGVEHLPDVSVGGGETLALRRRFSRALSNGEAVALDKPLQGCAVYMSRARLPDHIGIYLDGGVLHALESSGVVFTRLSALPFIGLKVLGFYIPQVPWPTSTSSRT